MSNLQPNYMKNQMQSVAAQAAIGQERVTSNVMFAITGDIEVDFVAAIMACFQSFAGMPSATNVGDGNRMAERVCEYLARRFKDQADVNEKITLRQEKAFGTIGLAGIPSPTNYATGSGKPWDESNPEFVKSRARLIAAMTSNAQSGTHSPSTMRPDSVGGS